MLSRFEPSERPGARLVREYMNNVLCSRGKKGTRVEKYGPSLPFSTSRTNSWVIKLGSESRRPTRESSSTCLIHRKFRSAICSRVHQQCALLSGKGGTLLLEKYGKSLPISISRAPIRG